MLIDHNLRTNRAKISHKPSVFQSAFHAAINARLHLQHLVELDLDDDDAVFAVEEGWLYLYDTFKDGSWAVVRHVAPGEFFRPSFSASAERPVFAASLGGTSVIALDGSKLREVVRSAPADRLWRQAQRLERRDLANWLAVALCGSAATKISFLLHSLGQRWGRAHPDWEGRYPFPATQDHLGAATGISPVHVNRCLQRLRAEGVLDFSNGVVTLSDALRRH